MITTEQITSLLTDLLMLANMGSDTKDSSLQKHNHLL